MTETPKIPQASEEENRAAHAVPSMLANRFHLTVGDMIARISFGEQVTPNAPAVYHQAVTMPRSEAILLAQMLLEMYKVSPEDLNSEKNSEIEEDSLSETESKPH